MAMSDDEIIAIAEKHLVLIDNGEFDFARAIEAEVRKDDDALIRQLVEALEGYRRNHNDTQPCDAEREGRARLDGTKLAAAPTTQPAPDEIINMAREQGLPETETEGVFRVNVDDLGRIFASYRAARAPADSVLEDAARYRWLAAHCRSTSEHWGGRWSIVIDGPAPKSHDSEDDFDAAIDAARKQGANHD